MRNLILFLFTLAFVSYMPMHVLLAEEQPVEKDLVWDLGQAQTLEEFEQATIKIQEKRSELITFLIRMLRKETEKEKKIRICYLLGQYKATEAIRDLSKNITLEAQVSDAARLPIWGKYPAQEALIKCGFRSIRYMISNIETSDDKQIQNLSVKVIWLVIGEGLSNYSDGKEYARMIIQKRINQESDPVKKARLEAALVYLANPKKKSLRRTQGRKGSESAPSQQTEEREKGN